jgi:hypothetical protein
MTRRWLSVIRGLAVARSLVAVARGVASQVCVAIHRVPRISHSAVPVWVGRPAVGGVILGLTESVIVALSRRVVIIGIVVVVIVTPVWVVSISVRVIPIPTPAEGPEAEAAAVAALAVFVAVAGFEAVARNEPPMLATSESAMPPLWESPRKSSTRGAHASASVAYAATTSVAAKPAATSVAATSMLCGGGV